MKRRTTKRLVAGVLLLAAGLGCSSSALKATPIWDDDFARAEGPAEDRLNVWPLLYYRDPALSLLWPLFSYTDEGHELVPLYAYDGETEALRLLSVSPELPAAAHFEPGYTRVLSVFSDRTHDAFAVLPFYYGSQDGFWTPPLTRFRKNDWSLDGWLAPLAIHIRGTDKESWHVAWPLLATWRQGDTRGTRAFPLFWSERRPGHSFLNVGGWLLHREASAQARSTSWLWPIGGSHHSDTHDSSHFVPFWYWESMGNASLFLSLPYQVQREGDRTWQSAFGLLHRIQDRDGSGHALLPLYWRYSGASTRTLLTFAGGYSKGPDHELVDVLGPVFWTRRTNDTRTTAVLWPLVTRRSSPDSTETRLLLGAAGAWKEASRSGLWSPVLTVRRSEHDPSFAEARIRQSLAPRDDGGARGVWLRPEVLSSLEITALLGMAVRNDSEVLEGSLDDAGEIVLSTSTRTETWLRPLWLLPVFDRRTDAHASSTELLWRLYDSRSQRETDGSTYTRQRILWRLLHRETLGARHSVDVFPFVSYDRDDDLLQWSFMGGSGRLAARGRRAHGPHPVDPRGTRADRYGCGRHSLTSDCIVASASPNTMRVFSR